MRIALSVVTISFDDPKGLLATIESLRPLFLDRGITWEHIVVEQPPRRYSDELTDLPGEWPLKLISLEPKGIYTAMNAGVRAAKGEVIWILNGGDTLENFASLKRGLQALGNGQCDLFVSGARLERHGKFTYPRLPGKDFVRRLRGGNFICHQAVLYRQGVFDDVGVFDSNYRIAADYDHHWRCVNAGLRVQLDNTCMVNYDMSGVSSNWVAAHSEFRTIGRKNSRRLSKRAFWKNELAIWLEFSRMFAFLALRKTPARAWLSKVWHRYKRLHPSGT